MRMKNQDERSPQMAETDSVNREELGDGDISRLTAAPFSIPPLLLPLPPTGSAVFARAWIRQVISSLFSRQLAQVWVAVAGSIDVENDFITSDGGLALLLELSSGKLGGIAGLPGGLPLASVGRTDLLSPPSSERLEGEKS